MLSEENKNLLNNLERVLGSFDDKTVTTLLRSLYDQMLKVEQNHNLQKGTVINGPKCS